MMILGVMISDKCVTKECINFYFLANFGFYTLQEWALSFHIFFCSLMEASLSLNVSHKDDLI